ncbi:hypothetical protein AaE_000611, partial [Aphanomyces astaci]
MTTFLHIVRWLWVLIMVCVHVVDANSLIVISQPTTITAGDAFNPPPVVQLIDDTGLVLTSINIGAVVVSIGTNPSIFGQLSGITGLSFPIVAGVAICTGLSINLVGSGYTLQFASLFHGLQTDSSPFDILLGPPFKLSTVSVSILSNPVGGILTPSSSYTVWIYQGLGKFFDLKIDKAGGPYVLRFLADSAVVLPGGNKFDTFPFTVSVGPAKTMVISEHPIAAFGGEAFTVQPTITLIDAGLNVLGTQTNMQVVATIYSNPSKGTLLPVVETRSNIIDGLASFKNLRIDAA